MVDLDYLYYLPDHSPKTYETLVLMSRGYDIDEIANLRNVSVSSIHSILSVCYRKVGTRDVNQLLDLAQRLCIV